MDANNVTAVMSQTQSLEQRARLDFRGFDRGRLAYSRIVARAEAPRQSV